MKNISIWKDTVKEKSYSKLEEDKEVDVLIIGGGITGVSTMYYLKNSGLKVTLVEQNKIGYSVTGNSTGKLNFLQNDLIDKIRSNFGRVKANKYISSQRVAIDMVVHLIRDNNIECELERIDSYLYTNKEDEVDKLHELEEFLSQMNINIKHNSFDYVKSKYCFGVSDTYLFHPLKFVYGLVKKGNYDIYENTGIQKIVRDGEYYMCYTDKCMIKSKYVVIASHFPYFNFPFLFPVKCSLEKSYLSASKYQVDDVSLISYSHPFVSVRNYKDYLIYLTNSHDITSDVNDNKHFSELLNKVHDLKIHPDYMWSNIDIITNDGLPYIGEIQDKMLIGTGYNTWGLTNGVLAGKIMSDIIMGTKNQYEDLFSPKRINMSQVTKWVVDGIKNMHGYILGYLDRRDNIIYTNEFGKDVMIYKDSCDEHKVYQHCPHLGCKLIFNEVEKTWDCPCHGSRFDIEGNCISGPANKDISVKKK